MRDHTPLLALTAPPSSKATSTRYVNFSALILAFYRMIDEALALDVFWIEGLGGWAPPVRGRQVASW